MCVAKSRVQHKVLRNACKKPQKNKQTQSESVDKKGKCVKSCCIYHLKLFCYQCFAQFSLVFFKKTHSIVWGNPEKDAFCLNEQTCLTVLSLKRTLFFVFNTFLQLNKNDLEHIYTSITSSKAKASFSNPIYPTGWSMIVVLQRKQNHSPFSTKQKTIRENTKSRNVIGLCWKVCERLRIPCWDKPVR